MDCSVRGITDSVVAEDKLQTELNVRKAAKLSDLERADAINTPMAFLTRVIKAAKPSYEGRKMHVLDVKRSEEGEFTIKYKLGQSPTVLELVVEDFAEFTTEPDSFQLDNDHLNRLYSDYDSIHMNDDFEALALDITNNPEKIIETAEALIEADEYHNDESHNRTLFQQLGLIQESLVEMIPNLNVHINSAGKANFGEINVDTNDIFISKGVGGSKSLMEIYVHELYHAVTHFSISSASTEVRGVTSRIEQIRDNFLKNTTEDDLVRLAGGQLTPEDAGKLLDHMTDPKVGLHEFVALAMTNKPIMNQLKTLNITEKKDTSGQPLFYRLLDAVQTLFGIVARMVTKEPVGDDMQRMVFLVNRLHNAHKKPLEAKRQSGIRNLLSIAAPIERKWVDFLDKKLAEDRDRPDRNAPKRDESNFKYYARLAARSFYDEEARDILNNVGAMASMKGGWQPLSAEGTVRTILRDFFESDKIQDNVERLGMVSQTIDQQREFTAIHTAKTILKGFNIELTEDEEIALTDTVLDTDLSSIYFNHDIKELLASNRNIDKAIRVLVKKLESEVDKESLNFYNGQTSLLATYMVTHEDNIALLKNAENIAKKIGTKYEDFTVSKDVIEMIDELTTLKALKRTSKLKKGILLSILERDSDGVEQLVAHHIGQKNHAEEVLFPTEKDRINIIKGYSAQITDPDIDITIAPAAMENELKAQGYELRKDLTKHEYDRNSTPMAVYVSHKFVKQRFHRVGMRMTDRGRRGTTITESYIKSSTGNHTLRASADITKLRNRKDQVVELMVQGNYDPTANESDSLVSPVLNSVGKVKDFSYGMDKQVKIDVLEMERKVSTVMGRTAASTFDKKATESFNHQLMEEIKKDAEKNLTENQRSIIGKNQKEYIKIEKDSPNTQVRDLWKILPNDVKTNYPEGFTLRRDLMFSYLGYRELSIVDLPGLKGFFDNNSSTWTTGIKYALQFAEKLWQELIKISKVDIIIRTPGVFIGNVVSNFMLMYVSGYSFKEITKLKLQGVKELNTYVTGLKESIELEAKADAGVISEIEQRRLNVIKNNLTNSPVKDLIDEGFYTTIIEEVEHGEGTGSYFNKLAKKKLDKMPKIFSDGVDLLYITENTKLFKLMEKSIQASDFAARYAQYHLMLEQGVSKEQTIKAIRDNFINYNKPNSRFVEWANQMGAVMFTKYFTRIQRVIREYGKNHPMKLFMSMLAQDYVFGDIDDITDQSILTKDMGNLFYNPVDNLMRVFTPTSAEAVDWILNK